MYFNDDIHVPAFKGLFCEYLTNKYAFLKFTFFSSLAFYDLLHSFFLYYKLLYNLSDHLNLFMPS